VTYLNRKNRLFQGILIISIVAVVICIFNRLINFFYLKNQLLTGEEGSFYRWRFGSVYYTKRGQGRPILLVPDLTSLSSGYEWHLLEEQLAKTNTVYTLDLLGCGRSDKPSITYTSFLYVQLIKDFLKDVIGEVTHVIGTGSSCTFIVETCNNDNTFIDKVALINPKPLPVLALMPSKRSRFIRQLLALPLLGTFLYNLSVNKATLTKLLKVIYFYDSEKVTDLTIETYAESSQKNKAGGRFLYASMISKLTNSNLTHSLARIENTIHIITSLGVSGNQDIAKEYQEILTSIEITTLENSNYLPQLETPEELLEQIRTLLKL
jgi:pimeloyl-ACP methyl ester carboxylesterase